MHSQRLFRFGDTRLPVLNPVFDVGPMPAHSAYTELPRGAVFDHLGDAWAEPLFPYELTYEAVIEAHSLIDLETRIDELRALEGTKANLWRMATGEQFCTARLASLEIPTDSSMWLHVPATFQFQILGPWYGKLRQYSDTPDDHMLNGDFETAGAGGADIHASWTETASDGAIADEGSLVHGGSHALKLTAGASINTLTAQVRTVTPTYRYSLAFWTRGDGTYAGRYSIYDLTNGAYIQAVTTTGVTGTDYTYVIKTFQAPAGCTSINVALWCPNTNGGIAYFDDVVLLDHRIVFTLTNGGNLPVADIVATLTVAGEDTPEVDWAGVWRSSPVTSIEWDSTANGNLEDGDVLTLDFGQRSATSERPADTDEYDGMTLEALYRGYWLILEPGSNTVTVAWTAGSGTIIPTVTFEYRDRWA